ncbi:MAG: T9SS type A sorting domain-containing protein [Bacteroidota bacterium]
MKKLFTLISLIAFGLAVSAQEFVPLLIGEDTILVWHAGADVSDINNDGNLDILIAGEVGGVFANGIFLGGGDKTFSRAPEPNVIAPGFLACINHGDIDADGDLDYIFNGWGIGGVTINGIAINDGSGALSLSTTHEIGDIAPSSGFADLNNDARLDYYFFGNRPEVCAIYFQNADGTFTKDVTSFASYKFVDPEVTIIDFNNDGYLDMFINGWEDNQGGRFSKVFINDYFGGFNPSDQPNIIQKGFGTGTWFDVDADGNLDLLLNGDGGANGEASSDVYRLYKNNNGTLEEAATFSDYRQISVGGGSRFADLDNDGDADIILTGWSNPGTEERQVTMVFECTDAASFTYVRHGWSDIIPGVSESEIEVADFNNDHKIDIFLSGFSGDFGRQVAGVFFNDMANANTLPAAPANLSQRDMDGGGVMFSWDAGSDSQTPVNGLTYSLYLKNLTAGKWLFNPGADVTGDANGKRKVTGMGNLDHSLEWPLYELPDGDYEWSVQSVDGAYEGSPFPTPVAFSIVNGVIGGNSIQGKRSEQMARLFVSQNMLNVQLNAAVDNATLRVYTIDGREVLKRQIGTTEFTTPLENGLYLFNISNGGKVQTGKVVVF